MYLEYVKVKNFGIHKDDRVDFQEGLVTVRGSNGAGKSTLAIQAPLYALFGASTLDATLDDTVTRGENVSTLKVEVKYGPYVIRRAKSSASVVGKGVKISGQTEVSKFFYDLFGIQKGTETKVLVAEQGKTAGILAGKPGEVNSFIEDMAGFDQIDDLIERVKLTFPSGQKAVLEDRLEELEERKDGLDNTQIPDVKKLKDDIKKVEDSVASFTLTLSHIDKDMATTNTVVQDGLKHNGTIELAARKVEERRAHLKDLETRLEALRKETSNLPVYDQSVGEAQELIDQLDAKTAEWAAFNWMSQLQKTDEWDDGLESFEKELQTARDESRDLGRKCSEAESTVFHKRKAIITDKTCSLCKQDVTHLHVEINEKLEGEIKELETTLESDKEDWDEVREYLQVLIALNDEQEARVGGADLTYLKANTAVVPYSYSLIGDEPIRPDADAVSLATNLISDYNSTQALRKRNQKDITILEGDVASLIDVIIPKSEEELSELGNPMDVTGHQKILEEFEAQKNQVQINLNKTNQALTESKVHLNTTEQSILSHNEIKTGLREDIKATLALIKEDGRNGKIVKAVRDAKPKVLELVWTKILYSVSTTFSDMVGWEAAVEKDTKGFRINGLPVPRLSGSEKTTLGIALRATLRDIFAPTAGCMFWDEPFADCDADRTAAALASIHSIPGQKIIITHESDSEMASDQFVEVGV